MYDPDPAIIRPNFKIFHLNETESNFYFGIESTEVLYSKLDKDTLSVANLKIRYKLFEQSNLEVILDSTTYHMRDTVGVKDAKTLYGGFLIPAEANKKYFLEVRIRDVNRDLNTVEFFTFVKYQQVDESNFMLLDSNDLPILNNIVNPNQPIKIVKSPWIANKEYKIEQYIEPFALPPPPFADKGLAYTLPPTSDFEKVVYLEDTINYTFISNGLYTIRDDSLNQVYAILCLHEGFPKLNKVDYLIEPTRYISTQSEFEKLNIDLDKKAAVDNFWLTISNDFNRAKQILGEYYKRVESANRYFTDVQEGWKTDRGLIYLIYGTPSTIYKGYNYENWVYGEETNMLSITFKFRRLNSPLSKNTYILERSQNFKSAWYRAVDNWRQGRVY
jgi:GWxTD domain-containing protein